MAAARETATTDTGETRGRHGRRGLIAGAAVLAAGLLTKEALAPERVAAANGSPILIGQINSGLNGTTLFLATGVGQQSDVNTFQAIPLDYNGQRNNGLFGAGINGGVGVTGLGGAGTASFIEGSGVVGLTATAPTPAPGSVGGVYGGSASSAAGVLALNSSPGSPANYSTNAGVYAQSYNGNGVTGINNFGPAGFAGVNGLSFNTAAAGVQGNNTTSGTAVLGRSNTGVGVYGISGGGSGSGAQPYGVVGSVTAAPGFGLFGVTSVAGTVGFAGGAAVAGGIAGQFSGPVNIYNSVPGAGGNLYVQGNFQVTGTKNAAVPHPDGTHRLLYCMESPESWFEDFGEGTITAGKAEVRLDPDFAAVVDTSKLHVFFTEHGSNHALHLAGRTATGFTVAADAEALAARGKAAGDVSGTFTYRVVAKRKDVVAERLAKFMVPGEIKPPALVIPPAPPTPPMPPMPPMGGKKG